ncbi:hypothetical protein E3N88_09241 [Mikania micrantha]|uniref:Uncharacterized protein n=1 Tax=Mikania micrantha TaxID=192012 RepID=A0A5N6PLK7_9ASTR|nr:hypothetical protein E3N88_09241 [Mikania micrantha]
MRLSNIIYLFIFSTLWLCLFTNCSTNDPPFSIQARRGLRTLASANANIDQVDGNEWSSTMSKAYDAINNEDAEIVYNIDYQGVKTHPSPNPKHP